MFQIGDEITLPVFVPKNLTFARRAHMERQATEGLACHLQSCRATEAKEPEEQFRLEETSGDENLRQTHAWMGSFSAEHSRGTPTGLSGRGAWAFLLVFLQHFKVWIYFKIKSWKENLMLAAPVSYRCIEFVLIPNLGMYLLFFVLRNIITNSGQSKLEHTQLYKLIHHHLRLLPMKFSISPNICGTKQ